MARGKPRGPEPSDDSTPGQLPQTTPPMMAQPGHDFTLQCVMELQKSVGVMSAKVDRLIEDVGKHGTDISGISSKINLFLGGATVVGVIAGVMFTIALQVPWSRLFERTSQPTPSPAITQPAAPPSAPAKPAN